MTVTHITPADAETFSFDWGTMKWFVSPALTTLPDFTRHPAGDVVAWERSAG